MGRLKKYGEATENYTVKLPKSKRQKIIKQITKILKLYETNTNPKKKQDYNNRSNSYNRSINNH